MIERKRDIQVAKRVAERNGYRVIDPEERRDVFRRRSIEDRHERSYRFSRRDDEKDLEDYRRRHEFKPLLRKNRIDDDKTELEIAKKTAERNGYRVIDPEEKKYSSDKRRPIIQKKEPKEVKDSYISRAASFFEED